MFRSFAPPRLPALVASGLCIALIGWEELRTPAELSFQALYIFPVALAAWAGGAGWGTLAGLLSGVAWMAGNLVANPGGAPLLRLWTGVNYALAFGFFAWLVHRLRRSLETQAQENLALTEALGRVKTIEGLFPICAWCRRMRNDEGYWKQVDDYLAEHSKARFTHGICPECAQIEGAKFKAGLPPDA